MYFLTKGFLSKALYIFLIFIVAYSAECKAQIGIEASFYAKGQLIDSKSNGKIVFAHIINTKTRTGTISDSAGIFIILAKPGDILQISSLGYQPKLYTVNDSLRHQFILPRIKMVEKVYEIKDVDIHFLGTYEQFKYRMLHTKPTDPLAGLNKDLKKAIDSISRLPTSDLPTFPMGSPISMLYMAFSKEGKQMRKLEEAMEKAPSWKIIEAKFNRRVLEDITGLKDEALNEFAIYCKLPDSFILKASDYELHEKIIEIFERYKKRDKDTTLRK